MATEKSLGSDTLLFCAPETLFFLSGELRLNDRFFERIVAVIVDEAHCVSFYPNVGKNHKIQLIFTTN